MKKSIIKRLSGGLLALFMGCSLLTGCGNENGTSGSGNGMKVLLIVTDTEDTFRKTLTDSIMEEGQNAGLSIDKVETGNNVEAQAEAVAEAKDKGYKAIILRPSASSTALQMNVASNDLPIIYVNDQPAESNLEKDKYIFVGSDEYQAGQYQAEFVLKELGNPKKMNAIIFEGEKGHSATVGRTASVKETLKNSGCDVNYVFLDYANWSDTEAEEKFNIFLKTGQSVDAVFCNNDTMAIGVVKAMRENGLDTSKIPVVGVDASKDGCKSVSEGGMSFTVLQSAKGQAKKAVEAAIALGKGNSISGIDGAAESGKYIWVPFEPVDKSNVNSYM